MAFLQEALQMLGFSTGIGLTCRRAADVNLACRMVLMSHKGASKPQCVFGDAFDRAPTQSVDAVRNLLQSYKQQALEMIQAGSVKRNVRTQLGRQFLR